MYPTLGVTGGFRLRALLSSLARPGSSRSTEHTSPSSPGVTRPEAGPCGPVPDGHEHDLENASDLNEEHDPGHDPDVSICKLSLTLDEKKHPRVHKGPYDRDFEPFM